MKPAGFARGLAAGLRMGGVGGLGICENEAENQAFQGAGGVSGALEGVDVLLDIAGGRFQAVEGRRTVDGR